jgi:hypothetical protein
MRPPKAGPARSPPTRIAGHENWPLPNTKPESALSANRIKTELMYASPHHLTAARIGTIRGLIMRAFRPNVAAREKMAGCCRLDTMGTGWVLSGPLRDSATITYPCVSRRWDPAAAEGAPSRRKISHSSAISPPALPKARWPGRSPRAAGSAPSYPMIQPTMIQASVAMTTLPAKTSGKNRPQLRLRQGAAEGSEAPVFI